MQQRNANGKWRFALPGARLPNFRRGFPEGCWPHGGSSRFLAARISLKDASSVSGCKSSPSAAKSAGPACAASVRVAVDR